MINIYKRPISSGDKTMDMFIKISENNLHFELYLLYIYEDEPDGSSFEIRDLYTSTSYRKICGMDEICLKDCYEAINLVKSITHYEDKEKHYVLTYHKEGVECAILKSLHPICYHFLTILDKIKSMMHQDHVVDFVIESFKNLKIKTGLYKEENLNVQIKSVVIDD